VPFPVRLTGGQAPFQLRGDLVGYSLGAAELLDVDHAISGSRANHVHWRLAYRTVSRCMRRSARAREGAARDLHELAIADRLHRGQEAS
jgi:hypothetical protein